MKKQINLNHELMSIACFDSGKTELRVKAGRTFYNTCVKKCALYSTVYIWTGKPNETRYNGTLTLHTVKNSAVLSKEFFINRAEIEKAQRIARIYRNTLEM